MKKIACCLFGQQRIFPLIVPNYLDYWEYDRTKSRQFLVDEKYEWETDWFCHTGRDNETYPFRHEFMKARYNYDMPKELGDREEFVLRDVLKCKQYEIEDNYSELFEIMDNYLPQINKYVLEEYGHSGPVKEYRKDLFLPWIHAAYSAQRVINMVREYEKISNNYYDLVFIFRPDVRWMGGSVSAEFESIEYEENIRSESEPNWSERAMAVGGMNFNSGWPMMSDWYFFGRSNSVQNFAENWVQNLFSLLTWYSKVGKSGIPNWDGDSHPLITIVDRALQCLGRRHPRSCGTNGKTLSGSAFAETRFGSQILFNNMNTFHPTIRFDPTVMQESFDFSYVIDKYPIWERDEL